MYTYFSLRWRGFNSWYVSKLSQGSKSCECEKLVKMRPCECKVRYSNYDLCYNDQLERTYMSCSNDLCVWNFHPI